MTKKILMQFGSAVAAAALCFALCACNATSTVNTYEVATQLGYDGDESSWLSTLTGSTTEVYRVYLEAVSEGYAGSYTEFLTEIGYSSANEDKISISASAMSVVGILTGFTETTYSYGANGRITPKESSAYSAGSGVIYSLDLNEGDAYIVTNYHVLYDADSTGTETVAHISDDISVYLYGSTYGSDESAIPATYVGGSMEYDIAVVRVEDNDLLKESYARTAVAANSDAILAGDTVYAIGNAEGDGISITSGVISVEAEYITMTLADEQTTADFLEIRTDAAVNHGNSGGGLFDENGYLIGIVNARSEEDGVNGFGYAIPSNLALSVAQNIIDNASANDSKGALRAMVGITITSSDSKAVYSEELERAYITETVTVKYVSTGTVAEGVFEEGDVLYSVQVNDGGEKVITRRHVLEYTMFTVRKGDNVQFVVWRDGEAVTLSVAYTEDAYFTLYD